MSLLNSRLNSIAAIAIDAAVNKASIEYVDANYYTRTTTNSLISNAGSTLDPTFQGTITANRLNLITPLNPIDVVISNKFVATAGQLSAQLTLSGGGTVTWTGTHLKWDGRVYVTPVQKPELATGGAYYLDCPDSGDLITRYITGSFDPVTVTSNGIPLSSWQALYWSMPAIADTQGGAIYLQIVDRDNSSWTPIGRDILLAVNNPDAGLKWMPAQLTIPSGSGLPATYNTNTGQASWTQEKLAVNGNDINDGGTAQGFRLVINNTVRSLRAQFPMSLSSGTFGDGTLAVATSAHRIVQFGDDGTNGYRLSLDGGVGEKILKSLKPGTNIQFVLENNNQAIVIKTSDSFNNYIDSLAPKSNPTFTGTVQGITKAMVGLSNVDDTSDANKPISNATNTALALKADKASPTFTGTVQGITKAMVGLSNVDDTSDANKPISNATQTALNAKPQISLVTVFDDGSTPGTPSFYYRLGTLVLPQNGHRASLHLEAGNGYNISAGANQPAFFPPLGYACDIYIHSSNDFTSVAVSGNTSGQASPGSYHYGYAMVSSLGQRPRGVYIVPDPAAPLTTVSVWVENFAFWGQPSVTATTTGTWTFSQLKSATLPNTGWVQLPLYNLGVAPWVLARINSAAASITFQNGAQTAVAAQVVVGGVTQVGQYQLTWPTTGLATSYIQLTAAALTGQQRFVQYLNLTATGCLIHIYDRNGTPQWTDVNIRVDVVG